jgi:hypothetical protein
MVSKSSTKMKRIKILKNYPLSRTEKDIETMTKLVNTLDKEVGISKNELLEKEFSFIKTKMDILLLYLRRVHAFDYYTSTSYENERALTLKIASAFLRIEADYQELE